MIPEVFTLTKLHIQINGKTMVALVDMGSTDTFVKEEVVCHLGLPVMPRPGLAVKVTNSERVGSQGVCRRQTW
jgi:hypothetical protein